MRTPSILLTVVAALLLSGANAALAHHSFAMFDSKTQLVLEGTVVRWSFNNPHSWLYVNVKNQDGTDTLWSFEGGGPTGLIQRGVTGDSIKPGNKVRFVYCPLRDGRPGGAVAWAQPEGGKPLNLADGGCLASDEALKKL